jgi:hypothetical protein
MRESASRKRTETQGCPNEGNRDRRLERGNTAYATPERPSPRMHLPDRLARLCWCGPLLDNCPKLGAGRVAVEREVGI